PLPDICSVIQLFAPGRTHLVNTLTQIRLPAEQRKVKHGCSTVLENVSIFFYKNENSPMNHTTLHLRPTSDELFFLPLVTLRELSASV
ncbi:MAG TPA: hypothetical protein VFE02_07310, partial [Candidatus Acidoferrales bacterium]|nr:hypothetical protein [Candidatus Acidoferrales bacterium]